MEWIREQMRQRNGFRRLVIGSAVALGLFIFVGVVLSAGNVGKEKAARDVRPGITTLVTPSSVVPDQPDSEPQNETPSTTAPGTQTEGGLDGEGHEEFSDQDLWAYLSDPNNSNLPDGLFEVVTPIGVDVFRSATAGTAQTKYGVNQPANLSGEFVGCCAKIQILGAGAMQHPSDRSLVQVQIVWSATTNSGQSIIERNSFIFLRPVDGSWQPVPAPAINHD